jgi:DNA-binding transcriptional ArsR family regulator
MSSIQSDIIEIDALDKELKSVQQHLKKLKKRREQVNKRIQDYLDKNDQPGVKYKGIAIIKQEKQKRLYKKKKDRETDACQFLEEHGIRQPKKFLEQLLEKRRGEAFQEECLTVSKYK